MRPSNSRGLSPVSVTAALSVAVFLFAVVWQMTQFLRTSGPTAPVKFDRGSSDIQQALQRGDWQAELTNLGIINTASSTDSATSTDPLRNLSDTVAQQIIGGYLYLKQNNKYTPENAKTAGQAIAQNVKAPTGFTAHDKKELKLIPDTSKARALEYRSDMRDALAVLITGAEPEFETFARYIETKNPQNLFDLTAAAKRYHAAEKATLKVATPEDAADVHLRAVNALGAFGSTIEQLVRYADSPLTSVALLSTYNDSEREMLYAFDALASYYVRKSKEN